MISFESKEYNVHPPMSFSTIVAQHRASLKSTLDNNRSTDQSIAGKSKVPELNSHLNSPQLFFSIARNI